VLGSGLSEAVVARLDGAALPYAKLDGAPTPALAGHPGTAHLGMWGERRVVAFAGRAHLYQGFGPRAVTYFIRLAAAAGARTLVLTNAAGGSTRRSCPAT
jgi:purine-nucleoside phosphorylase